jgi:Trk K+ transport system NAD-binding subunit
LLRSADETMAAVTVSEGSSLVGLPVGGLDVTVAAVRGPDGIEALPERTRQLVAGELLYVIGRPDVLRTVERAASGA